MARLVAEFLHIVSAMGVFCALGMEGLAVHQHRRAVDAARAEIALSGFRAAHRIAPLAGAATTVSGAYLAQTVWGWHAAWITTSLVCVVVVATISAMTAPSQAARMGQRRWPDTIGLSPSFTMRAGLLIGILFLMTVKPPFEVAFIAMAIAAVAGWLLGMRPVMNVAGTADPGTRRNSVLSTLPCDRPAVTDLSRVSLSLWLVVLIAAGIIFIGARLLVVPWSAAAAFGVPADGGMPLAYLWAKGSRDIVSGLLLLALVWTRARRRMLAAFVGVAALIPLADFLNVYANAGTHKPLALGIHGGTAAGMLVLAALLPMRGRGTD